MTNEQAVLHEVRKLLSVAGLRQVGDVEAWISGGEVLLKVAVAPEERPGAAAVPGRVREALRARHLTLAHTTSSASPQGTSPMEALRGHAVRVA
ncbi:hypothetical protein [Streptomyces sp. NPDC051546]|uniref:hypothetical protein n=1 Tax=Streptomyces sp. NPDC051546 TaxID=3365655 RepID=UPI003799AACD